MYSRKVISSASVGSSGLSNLEQRNALRQLHENYAVHGSPSCFYLTIDVRSRSIIWGHNTEHHLGPKNVKYPEYQGRIHPQWRDTVNASFNEAVRCFRDLKVTRAKKPPNYINQVPIWHSGEYYWYKLRTFPVSYDSSGQPAHVFAEFNRLCPFHHLVPSPAYILVNGQVDPTSYLRLRKASGLAMSKTLSLLLTRSGYTNLLAYRHACKQVNKKWQAPARQEMQEILAKNQQALNKANTRVLGALKVCFPSSTITSMADFAVFLNTIYGAPNR